MDSILIVAHGSSEDLNGDAAPIYAEHLSASLGRKVHHAYKSGIEPSLEATLRDIASEEPDRIVILPLFFAPGIFADRFVPRMFGLGPGERNGRIDLDGRDVDVVIAEAFGIHPGMRAVVEGIVGSNAPKDGRTTVMLIGHGSKDPANRETVELNAGYVRDMGFETVCCYNEFDTPTVEEGLEQALATGCDNIVAIPAFTSSSHHSVVEIPGKLGLDVGQKEGTVGHVRLIYTTEIGLSPGMEDVLMEEYRALRRSVELPPDDHIVHRIEHDEIDEHHGHRDPRDVPPERGSADYLRRVRQRKSPDDVTDDRGQSAHREDGAA